MFLSLNFNESNAVISIIFLVRFILTIIISYKAFENNEKHYCRFAFFTFFFPIIGVIVYMLFKKESDYYWRCDRCSSKIDSYTCPVCNYKRKISETSNTADTSENTISKINIKTNSDSPLKLKIKNIFTFTNIFVLINVVALIVAIYYAISSAPLSRYYGREENIPCFIVNTSTNKYHYPDCPYIPDAENAKIVEDRYDIEEENYSPCKHCHPDVIE